MFYSHEILTNGKHGVATIWLVATLGPKSSLKKVTRKAILDVDVSRACNTIIDPDAPMALRLQGSLLYGVSRVYSQQSGYLLLDTHNLRDKVKGALIVTKGQELDPEAGRARPDQLNLPDDPAFLPDLDMNFDLSLFDIPANSSRASSLLSPPSLQSSRSSPPREEDEPRLEFPSNDSMGGGFGTFDFGAGSSSALRSGSKGARLPFFEESALIEDPDLEIDIEGNIFDVSTAAERTGQVAAPLMAAPGNVIEVDEHVTDHMRAQDDARSGTLRIAPDFGDDDGMMIFGDDDQALPPAKPFPLSQTRTAEAEQERLSPLARPAELSSSSVEAPQRRVRQAKILQADQRTELTNRELKAWNTNYLANMKEAIKTKEHKRSVAQAKKIAMFWVLEQGIAGVGHQFAGDSVLHPLSVFSGQALLDALLSAEASPVGSKRSRESSGDADDEDEEARRVRARFEDEENVGRGDRDEGRALEDDGGVMVQGDDIDIEIGRHAPPSLPDHSTQMPWNLSASRHGSARPLGSALQAGINSSAGGLPGAGDLGPPSTLGRRRSRLTSASPLFGRGHHRLSSLDLPGQSMSGDFDSGGRGFGDDVPVSDYADFELYGPAAAVDTQTAAQSQWVAATLDNEAHNFLTFLHTQIGNRARQTEAGVDEELLESITFETLLPPADNTKIVGAQALLHVLTLATKGLVDVRQDQPFGRIEMNIAGVSGRTREADEEGRGRGGEEDD